MCITVLTVLRILFCYVEIPPLEYWKELAEQRRLALVETLDENEQVYQCVKLFN